MDPEEDAVPVSSADTDGLEEPAVEEVSAGELALIAIVAGAVLAEITGSVADKFTRLSLFRKRVRTYVGGMLRRTRAVTDSAMADARRVGRDTAAESLRRTGRGIPDGAGTPATSGGPATPTGPTAPGGPAAPVNPRDPAAPVTPSAPAAPNGRPDPTGPNEPPTRGRHRAPDFPDDMSLDDLRATAPIGPRTARGVAIRPPSPLLPQLEAMAPQMIAAAEGMYQQVMTEVLANPLAGEADRLRLAQKLIDRYAANGITGHIDARGRRWSMTTYMEMATRTATAHAAIDAHVALLAEYGYDLVRVSVHANCSNLCAPFQGNLLSATGATTSDGPESWRDRVISSLEQARARGFNHPNCKHWVTIWVPGDALPTAPDVDPADYKATQRLRYLERQVRASKRRRAAALTPQAATKANAATRALQTRIREHVAAHPTVPRMRRREQIGIAR